MLCWPLGVDGCFIVRSDDAGFETVGSYVDGSESTEGSASLTTSIHAIARASGPQPVFWTQSFDGIRPPLAAWSLGQRMQLVIRFADPTPTDLVRDRIGDLIAIVGVYVAGILAASDPRNHARRTRQVTTAPNLSKRQLQTLELIERNFTMRQIASRIGFSESTVRMESLAIYRALGVHDRRGAVSVGRKLGLLGPEREARTLEHN